MSETQPPSIEGQKRQELKRSLISLATELSQRSEGFSFPGIDEETRKQLKAVDKEYPGYTTPVDETIAKMEKEGIKIVPGEDGNVFVLPFPSGNVSRDSLLPRHLNTIPEMDASLRTLILTQKSLFESEQPKD